MKKYKQCFLLIIAATSANIFQKIHVKNVVIENQR